MNHLPFGADFYIVKLKLIQTTQIFIKLLLKSVSYAPPLLPRLLVPHSVQHNGFIKAPFACLQLWVPGLSLALTAALSDELIRDGHPQAHIVCHLKAAVSCSGGWKNRLTSTATSLVVVLYQR